MKKVHFEKIGSKVKKTLHFMTDFYKFALGANAG